MRCKLTIAVIILMCFSDGEMKTSGGTETSRHKSIANKTPIRGKTTSTTTVVPPDFVTVPRIFKAPNITKVPSKIELPKKKGVIITANLLKKWAEDISEKLLLVEKQVVRKDVILKNFEDIKRKTRDGVSIVETAAASLEDLLERRTQAAEAIGRKAESLAKEADKASVPPNYIFDSSIDLDKLKPLVPTPEEGEEIANNCSSLRRVPLKPLSHFGNDTQVELDISSVKVALEVFDCDYRILPHMYWSEGLLHTFQKNYALDAMTDFQYFCSAKGFLRHYPAASWDSMFKLRLSDGDDDGPADVYDCRLRPWYVAAGGAPRDIIILFDFSGSMVNSSNKVNAKLFTLAFLTALTDDDHVNVLAFNNLHVESVIYCLDDTLVPANHVNAAALMTMLEVHSFKNETDITFALREATKLLKRQRSSAVSRPKSCQQAIVLLSDSINENYTQNMRDLDPDGLIRLFVIWLHDVNGLRDHSREYSEWLSCSSDGYYAELKSSFDVTEQVMQVLRVLERPLVHQREERLRVFSDVYAHVEDPRRSEYYWKIKENEEQAFRYGELRRDKAHFLSEEQRYKDYMRHLSLDTHGYYYEGIDLDYRLQISVAVPVFDDTRSENITKILAEEKQRNATRTYPANRLLGVAGIDIPIEHLKLILPYYQLGAGGSLFIIDHRGNIVLHDNLKPVFDGDILRPGYRTVDLLDLEQSAVDHLPRNYSKEWFEFRKIVVTGEPGWGMRELYAKHIYDGGMRAILEKREYHWKRVMKHYTVVVSLPKYNKRHAVPEGVFTQTLAKKCISALKPELAVHPDWLYCRHVDQYFTEREFEVRHFVQRRLEEPDFKMQNVNHHFSALPPKLLEKTYMCNEELMARLCKEAMATEQWAEEHEDPDEGRQCTGCELGSVTAFFASESSLTRWQMYHMTSSYDDPPPGSDWSRGPEESWYKRAAASPGTLVIHAPVTPIRRLRNSNKMPPELTSREKWLTAARTLGHPDMVGVVGFHFHPQHFDDLLELITNHPFAEDDELACDGHDWECVLIDEEGWIVAGDKRNKEEMTPEDPVRDHLARAHPVAMKALLDAGIFRLHWVHDYQAICFPPEEEEVKKSATRMIPTILKSLWRSINMILHVTKDMITVIALISTGNLVAGDTEYEKEKRRNATRRNYFREKFETLFDERVLINRTRFAACDRSRALYQLQRTSKSMQLLKQAPRDCSSPVVGVEVPQTNLILLAINVLCPYDTSRNRPVNDPLVNEPVDMRDEMWEYMTSAARLACWRKMPLPIRAPSTTCFPHNYSDEEGYRQCGPWLPNPDPDEHGWFSMFSDTNAVTVNTYSIIIIISLLFLF